MNSGLPGTGLGIPDSGVLVNGTWILDSNRQGYSGFPELNLTSKIPQSGFSYMEQHTSCFLKFFL